MLTSNVAIGSPLLNFFVPFRFTLAHLIGLFMRFFSWPIFRLTLLTFRPQKRDKQVAPSGHEMLLEPAQTVLETYTCTYGVKGGS